MRYFLFISAVFVILISSCKKKTEFTQDHLDFSVDTLLFDTVFTTIGSTTKRFKIYNYNNQAINIEQIQLMGGSSSPFRINVDGVPSDYLENVEIPPNDSLYVFVEVTLEVNNATNPLVISDSIRFLTNGLNQYVNLDVWGQDAYFHVNELVQGTWANDKPHVIYGLAAVGYPGLDSNLNLVIPAGTEVYCHKDAQLIVYKSSLDIQGSFGNEVVFQGDRLESFYDDVSGQWYGIHLIESNASTIDYAIVKNGSVGIQVDSTQTPLTLTITNTIVDNHDFFSLNINAGAHVVAENSLFGSAGLSSAFLFAGGEYHFTHCNFVNYWTGSRVGAALEIQNYFENQGVTYVRNVVNSEFNNCLIWGTADKELEVDTLQFGTFDVSYGYNAIRRNEIYDYPAFANTIWDSTTNWPLFIDYSSVDYHVSANSPVKGVLGVPFILGDDLEGSARGGTPTLGCYE